MAAPDIDWPRLAFEGAASLVSALGGLLVGVWRHGRSSAKREHAIKDQIEAAIRELEMTISSAAKENEDRIDLLVGQFQESFNGIRRQIDESRLHTETNFLRKDAFGEFRTEYREDMRDIKSKIDGLPQRPAR